MIAATNGHEEAVRLLLTAVDPREVNSDNRSALHFSAHGGQPVVVQMLMAAKCHVDEPDTWSDGWSPIHYATQRGSMAAIESLLEGKADPLAMTRGGRSSLHIAASCGHAEVLTALCEASQCSDGFNIDAESEEGQTALHFAAHHGAHRAAEVLLRLKANPTACDRTRERWRPLHYATNGRHYITCKLLLEAKASPHSQAANGSAQAIELAQGDQRIYDLFVASGCLGQALGQAEKHLHSAAQFGDDGLVKEALAARANPNSRSLDGVTPLHVAGRAGSGEVCRCLLDAKALLTLGDDEECTVLHHAAMGGHESVCKLLLEAKASASQDDVNGRLPFEHANDHTHHVVAGILHAAANKERGFTGKGFSRPLCIPRSGCFN